jgi:hypothetical protein
LVNILPSLKRIPLDKEEAEEELESCKEEAEVLVKEELLPPSEEQEPLAVVGVEEEPPTLPLDIGPANLTLFLWALVLTTLLGNSEEKTCRILPTLLPEPKDPLLVHTEAPAPESKPPRRDPEAIGSGTTEKSPDPSLDCNCPNPSPDSLIDLPVLQ